MQWAKGVFAKGVVKRVAKSNDHRTTILGIMAAGLLAAEIDWGRLMAGDADQIGQAVGVLVVGAIGYYTNRPEADPQAEELAG